MAKSLKANIEGLRQIVANSQATRLRWPDNKSLTVDLFTASVIVKVYDAVNEEQRKKIGMMIAESKLKFARVADFSFKVLK